MCTEENQRTFNPAKRVLKASLKEQAVTDEVLSTVMAKVIIVNSRPLTRHSDIISDDEPISPNHLLHLRPTPICRQVSSSKERSFMIANVRGDKSKTYFFN